MQLPQQIERIVNLTEFNFFIMDIVKAWDFECLDVARHSMLDRNPLRINSTSVMRLMRYEKKVLY